MNARAKIGRFVRTTSTQHMQAKQPRVLLFGDSHCYAVQRAVERRLKRGKPVPLIVHRLLKTHWKNGQTVGDTRFEDFLKIIRSLAQEDVVLSMIGGNQHAAISTIQHPQRFDFLERRGETPFDSEAEIVPYRMLADYFASALGQGDGKSLRALRSATKARVIHILPPPPKRDNPFIEQYHETVFAREGIDAQGVSTAELRMKFWQLQTNTLKKLASKLNIELMLPPAAALDEAGFLARDYYANDATHANPDYGELVLRNIEKRYSHPSISIGQQ
jgi:hypothetical protein